MASVLGTDDESDLKQTLGDSGGVGARSLGMLAGGVVAQTLGTPPRNLLPQAGQEQQGRATRNTRQTAGL